MAMLYTNKHVEALERRINELTGNTLDSQEGHIFVHSGSGHYSLAQVTKAGGGWRYLLTGHKSKREICLTMAGLLRGWELAKELQS